MALDVVELVVRCEEEFEVGVENVDGLEPIRTVGDLFEVICLKMNLPPDSDSLQPVNRSTTSRPVATIDGSNRDAVWSRLVRICADQFQVAPDVITYTTRFVEDLGAD